MKLFLEPNRQIHNDSETKRFTVHVHVSQKKRKQKKMLVEEERIKGIRII